MDLNQVAEYVDQFREGDANAFEELYRITSKRVYFVCLNMLKDEQDANDAMQDTYLTACKSIRQLSDPKSFPSWIERIAINRCKNIIKQKKPVPVDDDMFKETLIEEDELTLPEEYILKEDKRKTLLKIMREQLSELQFQTVILYYFSNFRITEIAEIMECSEGAVKNRLAVSRSKIKKYVDEQEKSTGSKMFVFAGIPFLTKLFSVESESLSVPALNASVTSALSTAKKTEKIFKIGRRGVNIMSKKVIAIAAASVTVAVVGIVAAVSLGGNNDKEIINDTSSVSVSSAVSESSDSVWGSSIAPIENTTSEDDVWGKYLGNPLLPDNFEYYDLTQLDGHVIECGGTSSTSYSFIVTDDLKVYCNHIGGIDYFCTLDGEYERLVPLGITDGCNHLVTLNKDGSYTAYFSSLSKSEATEKLNFNIENPVAVCSSGGSFCVYTLDDGVINLTLLNNDGSIKEDHTKVEIVMDTDSDKKISNIGIKSAVAYNSNICIVDSENKLYHVEPGSSLKVHSNCGIGENVDSFLGEYTETAGYWCTQTDDSSNVYYQAAPEFFSTEPGEKFSHNMPDGYTTDDIKDIYCCAMDKAFMETTDKCIWVCKNVEEDGTTWEKEENLSELNTGGYVNAIGIYDKSGIALVGTNGKLYTFN